MNNGDKPAFPNEDALKGGDSSATGLTKREYFAAMAMQGLLSNPQYSETLKDHYRQNVITDMNLMCVRESIGMADELLKQLESNP